MQTQNFSIALVAVLAIFAVTGSGALAQTEEVIHSFNNTDTNEKGEMPQAGLIFDSAGNLYGTTVEGGTASGGVVFQLTPKEGGGWSPINILHNFKGLESTKDGAYPLASLIFDSSENLYGTTEQGGTQGEGTVFKLTPKAGGSWQETILHNFGNNVTDGSYPEASLIFDSSGNLYGTTLMGGTHNEGAVFELTPKAGGGWTEKILHNFGDNTNFTDGDQPFASLIFDGDGNLYGTTYYGGSGACKGGCGAVFELTPNAGGGWQEKILYSFQDNGTDGNYPYASLIFDSSGNLYGTTLYGGAHGVGTAFELSPMAGGGWTETVLHSFNSNSTDGYYPYASLIFDSSGNLYGTTAYGGTGVCTPYTCGTVFELSSTPDGGWTEAWLYSFEGTSRHDGSRPFSNLVFDASGNLYGTTQLGGANKENGADENFGTVFEITP
jgi:uncharacterized repeat protein (TIGR03803 family)